MTIRDLIKMYENNTQQKKANKSSNQVVINVANYVLANVENAEKINLAIENESSSKGTLNRGVAVECLIKALFKNYKRAIQLSKSKNGADLVANGVKYEIKCSTAKGYAHYNQNQVLTNLIFVNQYGIYIVKNGHNHIVLDKCGKHIQDIDYNKQDTTRLVEW